MEKVNRFHGRTLKKLSRSPLPSPPPRVRELKCTPVARPQGVTISLKSIEIEGKYAPHLANYAFMEKI
jgi:hypothetical protein